MMDCDLALSEVDVGLPHCLEYFTRDMMVCGLISSEVDLGLPHSLEYLY